MSPLRVIVCGGRDYADHRHVWGVLDELLAANPRIIIVQGGASGADRIARDWAIHHDVPNSTFEADWKNEGTAAGPLRNARMLKAGADLLIAFPGGRGTADMVRRAKAAGVSVVFA